MPSSFCFHPSSLLMRLGPDSNRQSAELRSAALPVWLPSQRNKKTGQPIGSPGLLMPTSRVRTYARSLPGRSVGSLSCSHEQNRVGQVTFNIVLIIYTPTMAWSSDFCTTLPFPCAADLRPR